MKHREATQGRRSVRFRCFIVSVNVCARLQKTYRLDMIIYPVSIVHCYLYNQPATVCIFIYLYSYIPSKRTCYTRERERYTDYPDETDDRDITDGRQSSYFYFFPFAKTVTQPVKSRVCAAYGSVSATDGERPTSGLLRSALVPQIEAKNISLFIYLFIFCKTTNPLNIKTPKEIFFLLSLRLLYCRRGRGNIVNVHSRVSSTLQLQR